MSSRLFRHGRSIAFAAVALCLAVGLHYSGRGILDSDAFNHLAYARQYLDHGPFWSGFPWIETSLLHQAAADPWYGFHLLIAPFAAGNDPIANEKRAGVFLTMLFIGLLFVSCRLLDNPTPELFPLLIMLAAPVTATRFAMMRPHVVTLGLLALVTALFLSNRQKAGAVVTFLACFVHMGLAWFVLVVIFACCLFRLLSLRFALASAGAALLGMAARPHPLGAFRVLFAQIPLLVARKAVGERSLQPLELTAMPWKVFFAQFWPFLLALGLMVIAGLACSKGLDPRRRRYSWLLLALTLFSLLLAVGFARRAYDLMAIFGGLFIALSAASLKASGKRWCRLLLIPFLFLCIPMAARSLMAERKAMRQSLDIYRYRPVAKWLARNSPPGSIVYHTSWGTFPNLLAWNRQNRYVAGVDPVFLYAYDPKLYYEYLHLRYARDAEYTCPEPRCDEASMEETRGVIASHFHADYLFVETQRHPLNRYARGNPGFQLVFETKEQVLFQLVTPPEAAVSPHADASQPRSATIDP